jgi:hypothetical protein
MDFLNNFNKFNNYDQLVIKPDTYNPISSKGGRRRNRSRKLRSRRHKKTNKSRTRRNY